MRKKERAPSYPMLINAQVYRGESPVNVHRNQCLIPEESTWDFRGHWRGKAVQRQPAALAVETEDNCRHRRLLTHNANVDALKTSSPALVCIRAAFQSPIFRCSALCSPEVATASSPVSGGCCPGSWLRPSRSRKASPPDLESPTAEHHQCGEPSGLLHPLPNDLQVCQ